MVDGQRNEMSFLEKIYYERYTKKSYSLSYVDLIIDYLFKMTGNFGVAIILITAAIRIIFFPLAKTNTIKIGKWECWSRNNLSFDIAKRVEKLFLRRVS